MKKRFIEEQIVGIAGGQGMRLTQELAGFAGVNNNQTSANKSIIKLLD